MSGWQITALILQSLAAIVVAGVAIIGLRKWRKDIVWKRKFEVAEKTLVLFYQIEDLIIWARYIWVSAEIGTKQAKEGARTQLTNNQKKLFCVPGELIIEEKKLFAELFTIQYSFMALFGEEKIDPFKAIHDIHDEIIEASKFLQASDEKKINEGGPAVQKRIGIIWSKGTGDPISMQLNKAVAQIEETCRPYLK